MPVTLTCHRCKQTHAYLEGASERWLTCPNCLASIPNPNPEQITAQLPPSAPAPPKQCRVCGEALQPGWRTCPHCAAPVQQVAQGVAGLDRDVRRDNQGARVWLIVMGTLLGAGTILFFAMDGVGLVGASSEAGTILLILVAVTLLVFGGVAVLMATSRSATTRTVAGTLGGATIGVTVTLGVVLLIIAAICAGIANFIDTCGGLKPPTPKQQKR